MGRPESSARRTWPSISLRAEPFLVFRPVVGCLEDVVDVVWDTTFLFPVLLHYAVACSKDSVFVRIFNDLFFEGWKQIQVAANPGPVRDCIKVFVGINAFRHVLPLTPLQSLSPAGPVDGRHPIEIAVIHYALPEFACGHLNVSSTVSLTKTPQLRTWLEALATIYTSFSVISKGHPLFWLASKSRRKTRWTVSESKLKLMVIMSALFIRPLLIKRTIYQEYPLY